MPIYNETWNENDYLYGSRLNLKSLTKNHLLKLKSLKFDFVEYKVSYHFFFKNNKNSKISIFLYIYAFT